MTKEIRERLQRYGIRAKKGLGQNFLVDSNYIDKILRAAQLKEGAVVVEIGPGPATLTPFLAEAVGTSGKVIAIEVDSALQELLSDLARQYKQVEIHWQDALQVDYDAVTKPYLPADESFALVANLPYYITTPIIMHLLEGKFNYSHLVVMVQKEVAERIVSPPGNKSYGALSVAVQYYCQAEIVTTVPPGAFVPAPKVSSAVLRLQRRAVAPVELIDERLFFQIVRAAFNQRRKTLLNALSALEHNISKAELATMLTRLEIDPVRRGETLTLAEFARIANALVEERKKVLKLEK
ncbi:16S rRNA (adenine(1518)-N(6)/adenine(1519)-N(6))-dimethyltransferase RsmA [Heliorestis acidaminivorans]|uniref:Ribosomal RNA small subunit methyltransferase A n=1 Tax=Heliorestis acidaminivorans TaxID=553427 RepID=A0A6I0EXK4_9FIRM|nr:16S rRNA (adenine(1518)-N(6)/adenine(1519)-N(6))-dimethyltransferase RsmA [Heliorestis acidaminivorans]KAB2953020.1 16S rRNA (adenine(1518)-N(6)/adenine(1519)-N(6))-dimethyltransferase RsmA [Heliorestis acidaminivorans]